MEQSIDNLLQKQESEVNYFIYVAFDIKNIVRQTQHNIQPNIIIERIFLALLQLLLRYKQFLLYAFIYAF